MKINVTVVKQKKPKKQKKDLINIQDLFSPKPLYHKEMFAGKIADWTASSQGDLFHMYSSSTESQS